MSQHLALAIILLITLAWVDLRTHRIPNRILLLGISLHLVIWLVQDERPNLGLKEFMMWTIAISLLLLLPQGSRFLQRALGMGDIKLIGYLLLFLSPAIQFSVWILFTALVSLLLILLISVSTSIKGGVDKDAKSRRVPFAPILLLSSIAALLSQTA
jgi:Flp pilus assembly protein protease CpaA